MLSDNRFVSAMWFGRAVRTQDIIPDGSSLHWKFSNGA